MKRFLTLAVLFLLPLFLHGATATFSYTFANPVCSATVTTGCISGFAVGTVTAPASTTANATFVQLATCPLPAATTGTQTGITCNFTGTAPLGSVTFAVVALAVDSAGNPMQSPLIAPGAVGSNETAVTVKPSSPSGVVIVFP